MPFRETLSEASSEAANTNTDVNTYFAQPDWNVRNPETLLRTGAKVLDDTTADENTKTEAVIRHQNFTNIVTETNIENLVKSKGFVDCVAFIQNGACNVVVQKDGEFASADAIAIKDIVVAQAKISADKITIVSK
ncbi:MAG: SpoIIIAH-like family protein [Acutalibacteraceae bacterium]